MSHPYTLSELSPYLRCKNAAQAVAFYEKAFGAELVFRLDEKTTGRLGHAEMKIGAWTFMLSDEYPEMGIVGPQTIGGTGAGMHLQVNDVDAWTQRAAAAGATLVSPPADQFYGHRSAKLLDPYGHEWRFSQEIEKVSVAEMQRRYDAMFE